MHDSDPEDVFGYRLDWMLPKPVPFGYRFMPSDVPGTDRMESCDVVKVGLA